MNRSSHRFVVSSETAVKRSVILDVSLEDWTGEGPPIRFTNREIRKMLYLADAGKDDVFYDLGSGWGQNLIIAVTEYDVKKAVGIEDHRDRFHASVRRFEKRKIPQDRWTIICNRFEKVLAGKVKEVDPKEATIMFYGLETDLAILKSIAGVLADGAKLVYYYNCLFPEIMPVQEDFPFYMSKAPFKRPKSEFEWLAAVVRKARSSLEKEEKPSVIELWDELRHDYDVLEIPDPLREYRTRLKKSVVARDRILK